ncbi:hypothetical protein Ahia01_000258000 [Argonauta hians]
MNFSTNYGDDIKEKLFPACDVNRESKNFRTRDLFPMEVVDMILENNENGNYCVDENDLFQQDTEKFFPGGNQEELNGNLRMGVSTVCIPNPSCDTFQTISCSSGGGQLCNSSSVYNVANTVSNNLKDNNNNIRSISDGVCVAVSSAPNVRSSLGTRIRAPIQKVSEQVLINPLANRQLPVATIRPSQASILSPNIGLALRSTVVPTSATPIPATSPSVADSQITSAETIRQVSTNVNTIGNDQICNSQAENSLGTAQNPSAAPVQNSDLDHTIPVDFSKLYSIAGHLSNPAESIPSAQEKTVNEGANRDSAGAVDRQQQQQKQQQPEAENVLPFIHAKTRPTDLVANSCSSSSSSSSESNNINSVISSSSSSHNNNTNSSSSNCNSSSNNPQSETATCDRQEVLVGRRNHEARANSGVIDVGKSVSELAISLHESSNLLYESDTTNNEHTISNDKQRELDQQQGVLLQQQTDRLLDSLSLESVNTNSPSPSLSGTNTSGLATSTITNNNNDNDIVGIDHVTRVETTKSTTTITTSCTTINHTTQNDNINIEALFPTTTIVTESQLSKIRNSLSQTTCPSLLDGTINASSSASVNKELIEALSAKIRQRMNDNINTLPLSSSLLSSSPTSTISTTTTTTTTTISTTASAFANTTSSTPPLAVTVTSASSIATPTSSSSSPLPLPSISISSSITTTTIASPNSIYLLSSPSSTSVFSSSTCSTTLTSSLNPCSTNSAAEAITTSIGTRNNISLNISSSSNNNNRIIAPTVNVSLDDGSHRSCTSHLNNKNNNSHNNDGYNHHRNLKHSEEDKDSENNNCGSLLTAVIAAASDVNSLNSSPHFQVHNGPISVLSDHHRNMVMVDGTLQQHGIDDAPHHTQHHHQQQQHQQQQQQVDQLYNLEGLHYVKQENFLEDFGGGSSSGSCADLAAAFDSHRLNSLQPVSSTALLTATSTPPGSVDTGGGSGGEVGGGGAPTAGNIVNGNTTTVNGSLITNSQGQCLQILQPVQVQQQQQQHAAVAHSLQLQQQQQHHHHQQQQQQQQQQQHQQRAPGLNNTYQSNDAYFNNFFGRTPLDSSGQGSPYDNRDLMNRLMMQPAHYFGDQPVYSQTLYGNSLQSPDSGYHECMSPTDVNTNTIRCLNSIVAKTPLSYQAYKDTQSTLAPAYGSAAAGAGGADLISEQKPKYLKRRRSQSTVNIKGQIAGPEKLHGSSVNIPKLENDTSGYRYIMETPTSTTQRIEEDRITYLNKGQYYTLLMENIKKEKYIKNITVTTLILVNFREPMSLEKNLIAWELWSDRQHSTKTRILDIDTKNGQGILSNSIEELSHNAVSVKWKPSETPSLVNIAINCLSTDFSNQKGVKGIPLHIQVDTYEGEDRYPVHRGYCQVKIFCDKGAERKTRDEERRRTAKVKTENSDSPSHSPQLDGENDLLVSTLLVRKRPDEIYHQTCERSEFYSMQDLTTEPQLFNPLGDIDDYRVRKHGIVHYSLNEEERVGNSIKNTGDNLEEKRDGYPPAKVPRRNNFLYCMTYQKVMLYVREQTESTFTALLLRTPTVDGLLRAVEEKYEIPASKVKNTYKRSKKGVLVKMDNNIIQHYAHETTFIIEKCRTTDDKGYEIILTEIDP